MVVEFRLRAHDGQNIWGLFARPAWGAGPWPTRIRSVGPADRPVPDRDVLGEGCAEFIFQEPAGRHLRDRVLDAIRVSQLARETKGVDCLSVAFTSQGEARIPDEFMIAEQLLAGNFLRTTS